jgi:hypothetical protein
MRRPFAIPSTLATSLPGVEQLSDRSLAASAENIA